MNFECPICNELGDARGDVAGASNGLCMISKCGHVFHRKCMDQWQTRSKNCPSCRQTCVEVWPLFGATKAVEATPKPRFRIPMPTPTSSTASVPSPTNGQDYEELSTLYTTLLDDYKRVTASMGTVSEDTRRRDRRSDQKDLEILQLKTELRRRNLEIEELETKLAMSESLIS